MKVIMGESVSIDPPDYDMEILEDGCVRLTLKDDEALTKVVSSMHLVQPAVNQLHQAWEINRQAKLRNP
jgi:flagellar basal body rod protein FlgF